MTDQARRDYGYQARYNRVNVRLCELTTRYTHIKQTIQDGTSGATVQGRILTKHLLATQGKLLDFKDMLTELKMDKPKRDCGKLRTLGAAISLELDTLNLYASPVFLAPVGKLVYFTRTLTNSFFYSKSKHLDANRVVAMN